MALRAAGSSPVIHPMYTNEHIRELVETFGIEEALMSKINDTSDIIDPVVRVQIENIQNAITNFMEDIYARS